MLDDAKKIIDAQQARGLETKGSLINRLKSFIPLIMPLILSSIELAYERTISLEVRAFFSKIKRTSFRLFKWKTSDTYWLASVLILTITGVLLV
jgi:energy-coupling factor transporter transmembrane protein EcfT